MLLQEDKDQEDAIAERKKRQREERERLRSRGRPKVRDNDLDPMDPAAYSDIPRFVTCPFSFHLITIIFAS